MNKETLNLIGTSIAKINDIMDNIAFGGCAVFAHALGTELVKNGIPVNIISIGRYGSDDPTGQVDYIRQSNGEVNTSDLYNNDVEMCHVLVEVEIEGETIYLDSYGINHLRPDNSIAFHNHFLFIDGRMTLEDCGIIARDEDAWNPRFNRSNIPVMYNFVCNVISNIFSTQNIPALQYA